MIKAFTWAATGVALGVLWCSGCSAGSEPLDRTPRRWLQPPPAPQATPEAKPPATTATPRKASALTADYVIVTADHLQASARRWQAYRQSTGHRVALLLTSALRRADPLGTVGATGLRRAIQAHLRARWEKRNPSKPLYVLLLGDAPTPLPAFRDLRSISPITTDNPYGDVDGDGIPELTVGRVPARTDAEADAVLAKVKRYETTYRVGPWNRRLVLFGAPGDYGAFLDSLLEGVAKDLLEQLSYDYDVVALYGSRGSPWAWPPKQFSDRVYELLNAGSLFTVYIGHGTETGPQYGWWNGKSFDIWNTKQLRRKLRMANKAPLLLLVACDMGQFDDTDGVGERLLRHPHGPPAVIGATGVSHPYPNTLLAREMGLLATHHRVATAGLLLQRAKRRMLRQRDPGRDVLEGLAALVSTVKFRAHLKQAHLRLFNLLGDPALRIRYVQGRARLSVTPVNPHPGDELTVTATFDKIRSGTARITLETRRKEIHGTLRKLPPDSDPRRDGVLRRNHRVANDKVLIARAVRFTGSRLRVTLPLPRNLRPGTYYVKLYAEDGRRDAVDHRRISLR